MADNHVQDALLEVDSTVHELRKMDMDSTSNPAQESEEREERRIRKWANRRSSYNDSPSRTYYRETRWNTRWSSQYHSQGNYGGYVSNQRWSHEYNRWENSNRQSRTWHRDAMLNTGWSNERPRQVRYGSDRADDVSCSDGHNRQGRHGSHRADDTTWLDEHHRQGRHGSHRAEDVTSWSDDRHRQGRYGSRRAEDTSWPDERNRLGRYGSRRYEGTAWSDGHHRQGRYGSNRVEHIRSSDECYRSGRHWTWTHKADDFRYSSRGKAMSYHDRHMIISSVRKNDNVKLIEKKKISVDVQAHGHVVSSPAVNDLSNGTSPQFLDRRPISREATGERMDMKKPISYESIHSDLTSTGDTSFKQMQMQTRSHNIEDESELKSERSSVYDNASISEIKPISHEGKSSELISMGDPSMKQVTDKDGRFENEQEQVLERFSVRSEKSIEVPLAQSQREKDHPLDLDVDAHALHPLSERLPAVCSRRKLLILDINGLLADIIYPAPKACTPDAYISRRAIFKRPFCHDFLKFCFERFHVGIWSSRTKRIIDGVVDYLLGDMKHRLLLCWDLSHCTPTKYKTLENNNKGLVFKELRKIWEQDYTSLSWKRGEYNESNTLLLDDSPYKALLNPMHSAIFPNSYSFKDAGDNSLGPEGDLRVYLQNLAAVENVQKYVEQHPFGQKAIDETDSNWSFYHEVISSCSPVPTTKECEPLCMPPATT